jgi:hypothetical protein
MDILTSLAEISTQYSVFEENQVLTHEQLNSVARYLDDQSRLSRVKLLGVGIACGLRVSVAGSAVKVSRGVGVTTDGDLLYCDNDTVFDKFKLYDASNPKYPPFYLENDMIAVYEFVRQGETDARAALLSQFNAQTGRTLGTMVAVLFMESFEKDSDLCTDTDCDNLGRDCIHAPKLLLVDQTSVGLLQTVMATPHQAFSALKPIVPDRPLIPSSLTSLSQLAQHYRTTCDVLHQKLMAELPKVVQHGAAFLADLFPSDPFTQWSTSLSAANTTFGSSDSGIQYYYDFLKDVVETYNQFRDLLFGDTTWCCPRLDAFPKHLLLGGLAPGSDPAENRTGFYPSPLASRTAEQLGHARFLARKLHTLIQTFQPPASTAAVRITPSLSEEHPLEERAIPYYYQVNTADPIQQSWNYRLHQRGMDAHNYSYNAGAYRAQGGAASPLASQIGRFPFFRIEGHLGQNVAAVLSNLEQQIKEYNLPFVLRSVMLGTNHTEVVKRPGIRYTDLHRFHYLLRQDAFHQLDEVRQFSDNFKEQVDKAVAGNIVSPDDSDGPPVSDIAAQKSSVVRAKANDVRDKLNRSYTLYQADTSWQDDLNVTMMAAGEFKYNLGKVVKTEFSTPFDSLISNTHTRWLQWLDQIIKRKDASEDGKLLFSSFIDQHPGMEHFAGVTRGGTFVLVYDGSKRVVADFMLPYACCEATEEEPEEPALPQPGLKPPWNLGNGIKVLPSRDKFVLGKLDVFKSGLEETWKQKLDIQKDYLNVLKDSVTVIADVYGSRVKGAVEGAVTATFTDSELNQKVNDARTKHQVLNYLVEKASQPEVTEEKRKVYEEQAKEVEGDLANAISETAKYIDTSGKEVSVGSEGMAAMMEMDKGLAAIKDSQALKTVENTFTRINTTSANSGLKMVLGSMVRK